jgi:hypothetical protein
LSCVSRTTRSKSQIQQGTVSACAAQRDFHQQLGFRLQVLEIEPRAQLSTGHLREVLRLIELPPEAAVLRGARIRLLAIVRYALAERYCEVHRARAAPAIGLPIARDQRVVLHANEGPHVLVRMVVDAVDQIEDHVHTVAAGEFIAVHPYTGGGR